MNVKRVLVAAVLLAPVAGLLAQTAPAPAPAPAMAKSLKWGDAPPQMPKGMQMAVIAGDPGKEGPFVIRAKMPANYKIPAHWHPTDENVTVLSGTLGMGYGDALDAKKGHSMGAGDFMSVPAKTNHFLWTKTASVIQVHANGPFAMTYVNPSDDPTAAAKPK